MNKEQGLAFLSELVDKINNQNNRGTAMPYFYVIKTEKWRPCKEGYGTGETRTVWVDWEGDPTTFHSKEEFVKWYLENHDHELTPPEALDKYEFGDPQCVTSFNVAMAEHAELVQKYKSDAEEAFEKLEEFEEEKYNEEENVFFTQEAFEEHVKVNGHNLGRRGEYYSYIKHAFRNSELSNMFQAIAAVTGKELGKK